MARGRSPILLLAALAALLALPAPALAQDTTPPTNDTPATPSAWQTSPYVVTLSGTDELPGTVRMRWRLGAAGTVNEVDSGTEITVSDLGGHDFQTQAVDVSDNASAWRSETLRIDTVDPTDATDPGGTGWRTAPTTVSVDAVDITSGVQRVEWILDGAPVQSGPNGTDVAISGDGTHTLRTRAVDVAGNVSDWRDHTIRVDTVNPTDVTAMPAGWQTQPLAVTVNGADAHSGITHVAYRVDGGPWTVTTTVPATFTVSAEGEHLVETYVRDAAGRESAPKSHTVRIDRTAPVNQTQSAPAEWLNGDYNVLVTAADGGGSGVAKVQWRIDGGPWLEGPNGSTAAVTGTRDHTLETRAFDLAGNVSVARLEHVRIDKTVPTNTTAPPPGGTVGNNYQVAVTGTDAHSGVASVQWQVDAEPVQSGAPGAIATVSGEGSHTLKTQVIDGAGNASGWRTDNLTIDVTLGDTQPPIDTTTAGSNTFWNNGPVIVTVSAVDGGSGVKRLEWRIPGEATKNSPTSTTVAFDTSGDHVLETRAIDIANNASAWRRQHFKVDLSVPVDATGISDGWQSSREFTLGATDAFSGVAEIQYTIDGGPELSGTPGQVVSVGADGVYTVVTRVFDNAGHSSAHRTSTLRVDGVDPVNTSAVPGTDWLPEPLALELTGTDDRSGIATMQWRVDGGEIHDGGPAIVAADGAHTLETRAVDAAGNTTDWRSDALRIDATAPVNTTPAPPGAWRRTPYSVVVSGDDGAGSGIARIERTVDGGAVSEDANVTVSGDGVHTLRTRIVDNVGHASDWREDVIRIDGTAPAAAVACDGGTGVWSRAAVTCSLGADGGPSGLAAVTLSRDGGARQPVGNGSSVGVGDGVHVLALAATDGAGNHGAAQATVYVDATAPAATLTCAPAGSKHSCRADASDATSGLASVAYRIDGGDYEAVAAGGTFTVAEGKVALRAIDVAGNVTVTAPVSLTAGRAERVKASSVPVYLAGHKDADSLVGALEAARSARGTVSIDLRPLAVGRGRFKVEIKLKAGKRSKRFRRTYRVGRQGTLPRIATSLAGARARCTIKLTVRKRAGTRWRRHAATRLVLAK